MRTKSLPPAVWDYLCHHRGWSGPRRPNALDSRGTHVLEWAVDHAPEYVEPLLKAGADPARVSRNLLVDSRAVPALLAAGAAVDRRDADMTALMVHIVLCNVDAVRALLAAGADASATDEQGWSCLRQAMANASVPLDLIEVLLAHGAQGPATAAEWEVPATSAAWAVWEARRQLKELPPAEPSFSRPRL